MIDTAPSHQPSNKWVIKFKDNRPPNSSYIALDEENNVHYMELKLKKIYEAINKVNGSG